MRTKNISKYVMLGKPFVVDLSVVFSPSMGGHPMAVLKSLKFVVHVFS